MSLIGSMQPMSLRDISLWKYKIFFLILQLSSESDSALKSSQNLPICHRSKPVVLNLFWLQDPPIAHNNNKLHDFASSWFSE